MPLVKACVDAPLEITLAVASWPFMYVYCGALTDAGGAFVERARAAAAAGETGSCFINCTDNKSKSERNSTQSTSARRCHARGPEAKAARV